MSFGDINTARNSQRVQNNVNSDGDALNSLRISLSTFQKNCLSAKDKITELRRRKVSPQEKSQLDVQLKDLRSQEQALKKKFDITSRDIESVPRNDSSLQRATISKLYKDYERLKVSLDTLFSESQLIKASENAQSESFARVGEIHKSQPLEEQETVFKFQTGNEQTLVLKPLIQEHNIDEVIIEEREREILKLNSDLVLVNDMFRRMADIVEKQDEHVNKIHAATEESHDRAQAGLDQIKQAAHYQPGCILC